MIEVTIPSHSEPEARYAVRVLLGDHLGIPHRISSVIGDEFVLAFEGRRLRVGSSFLLALSNCTAEDQAYTHCDWWDSRELGWPLNLCDFRLPVPFGKPSVSVSDDEIAIAIDIFGTAFFMLSRYEETIPGALDSIGRFPVERALSFRSGFLDRPIVDEYAELLFAAIQRLWPAIGRKLNEFKIIPTHDVDSPFLAPKLPNWRSLTARIGSDLLRRRSPQLAVQTAISVARYRSTLSLEKDPFNIFEWLLQQSERADVSGRFYFMTHDEVGGALAGRYNVNAPEIKALISNLANNGQEIGIHPTSESFIDGAALSAQVERITETLQTLGVDVSNMGGRQHYLRWSQAVTPSLYEKVGISYDSTLGHGEMPGFRCGTSRRFPLWSFDRKAPLKVYEEPLIMMECSLLSKTYMGLSHEHAFAVISRLKQNVRRVAGSFIFLWHNDQLLSKADRQLYCECLSAM